MHPSTFEYLKPTDEQLKSMTAVRTASAFYCEILERMLPEGPDKTFVIRAHRSNAMWANVAITRQPDGAPRSFDKEVELMQEEQHSLQSYTPPRLPTSKRDEIPL